MAQAKQIQQVNSFVAGLITEATELTFPPNASYDELNCVLSIKGSRRRRLGIDFEPDYALSSFSATDSEMADFAISTFTWKAVGSQGNLNFLAVQWGDTLYFYDFGSNVLSSNEKSFTVDLSAYLAPSATVASRTRLSYACGRGDLFIVSPVILPLQITYDADADTISVSEVEIRIRDFDGIDDGLEVDEETGTLTTEHHYNLLNQGWFEGQDGYDPINGYHSTAGNYPANNIQWISAKNANGSVNTALLRRIPAGTTEAPKGHFILDPFYKDRSMASSLSGIPVEEVTTRPAAVAFYAGRIVFLHKSDIYVSQVLNQNRDNVGKCYQNQDPTAEDLNALVDNDGLVINIPEAGNLIAALNVGFALLVFATNGVWSITGSTGGFKATDFFVNRVTNSGIISAASLVSVEGIPCWFSDTGIYTVQQDKVSGLFTAVNMTDTTIRSFYIGIPSEERAAAVGEFDTATRCIVWLYREQDTLPTNTSPAYYTKALVYDTTLKAFYPWTISSLEANSPFIAGIISSPALNEGSEIEQVVDSNGNNVIKTSLDNVVANIDLTLGNNTFIKYLTVVPNAANTNNNLTFSLFSSLSFTDWPKCAILLSIDAADYDSYLETGFEVAGDLVRFKQNPYIFVHVRRTETGVTYTDDEVTSYDNPSGLYLRSKWEWSSGSQSGKWSTRQNAYRLKSLYLPGTTDASWDNGFRLTTTRLRIRGDGRAAQLRFESESGKDFDLIGWGTVVTGNTDI